MTSTPGAVRRCTLILWSGKASEKTPRGVFLPVCVKYRKTPQEKKNKRLYASKVDAGRPLTDLFPIS
jgi:hypothetical protein